MQNQKTIKIGLAPDVCTGNLIVIPKDIDEQMPFKPVIEEPDYIVEDGNLKPKKSPRKRRKKADN